MKLSKYFRRHGRVLLMIFMSLLLVAFLIPNTIQSVGQDRTVRKMKIGRAFGRDIYVKDRQAAEYKRELLDLIGLPYAAYLDALDVYLLIEEARRLGVYLGHDQVKAILAQSQRGDVAAAEKHLTDVQRRTGRSPEALYDVAGQWLAVLQLAKLQRAAIGESLPRAELTYRNRRQQADVKLAVLDAHAFGSSVPAPSEPELQVFFERNKDQAPQHTEDELHFGYRLPNRVQLEYLTVDPRQIESKVHIKDREAQAYFEDHRDKYMKTVTSPVADTQSAQPRPFERVPMTYDEAQKRVKEDLRKEKAIREAQNLVNEIRHTAYQPWHAAAQDEEGFRQPPPPAAITSFQELCQKFSDRYEVTYFRTDLLSQDDILKLLDPQAGSREPIYKEGRTQLPLSKFALRVKGLVKPDPKDTLPVLNVLEPSPVLMTSERVPGSRESLPFQPYVFRVVEVAPAGPPASLDAVRGRVVADYRMMKAYEIAGEHARQLGERARQVGLATAVEEATALKELLAEADEASQTTTRPGAGSPPPRSQYLNALGPTPGASFTREYALVRDLGGTGKVRREIFAIADEGLAEPDPTYSVRVLEIANEFKWVVAELDELRPLYAGQFDQQRASLLGQDIQSEQDAVEVGWIAPGNVQKRVGFVPDPSFRLRDTAEP